MKRLIILFSIISLCQLASMGQKKYEMVIEKKDGTSVVIKTEDINRTFFREVTEDSGNTDNDDSTPNTNVDLNMLCGKWEAVYQHTLSSTTDYGLEVDEFECYYSHGEYLQLNSDFTGEMYTPIMLDDIFEWNTGKHVDNLTWTIKDDTIYFLSRNNEPYDPEEVKAIKIIKLTDTEMTLYEEVIQDKDNYIKTTCKFKKAK